MLCNFLHFQAHCFMKFSDDTWLVNNHALLKEIILFPSVKNTKKNSKKLMKNS